MGLWYPRLELLNSSSEALTVPTFSESVRFFDANDKLTEYAKSDDYGKGVENPRVYAAIVFDSAPLGSDIGSFASIEYSLRLNSTVGESVVCQERAARCWTRTRARQCAEQFGALYHPLQSGLDR
ncbi:hypothetical protein PR003_g29198 [Phytophthora rubi]|uniref:Uncharacterized protein n=1 Tax=Phytophthora rubi TaxID=129364 RepID=A0A6A4BNL3_9STRA|nr:hypothetical protein PR002_g28086 [Phytophthora rubi]KAE8967662.1 hypothetical protein PR001_g28037 [Phytophthora rubi]KAE9275938.1 hypothetical protein PR003_g29198 [Phytophthora rubi]